MMNGRSTAPAIRVLAVDDHPLLLDDISSVIEGQPDMHVVAKASNGRKRSSHTWRTDPTSR